MEVHIDRTEQEQPVPVDSCLAPPEVVAECRMIGIQTAVAAEGGRDIDKWCSCYNHLAVILCHLHN